MLRPTNEFTERGEGKSPPERGVGVCSPPLMGGVGEGAHLRLLQEPLMIRNCFFRYKALIA